MTAFRSSQLALRAGHGVSWNGKNWLILDTKDGDQALCEPFGGGRRKLIPVGELAPIEPSAIEAAASRGAGSQSKWQQHLRDRRLRGDRREADTTERQRFQQEQAINTYQECKAIAEEPDRRIRSIQTKILAHDLGVSLATAYRRREATRVYDNAAGLKRAIRKDAGELRHPEETLRILGEALAVHRFTATKKTVEDIRLIVKGELQAVGLAPVSKSFIYRQIRKTTRLAQLKSEGRLEEVRNEYRLKVERLPNMNYPLETIQVDHSPIQMCLVDSKERKPMGDAWLTLVIDCFSRMILGFLISLNAPSTHNYGLALAHAFLPKDQFLRQHNVPGIWPCWGFGDNVVVDNAAELTGRMSQRARKRHKFTIRRRPVGQPQFGGHVESVFASFMEWIKSKPGTKFSNPREKAEYDEEKGATYTISEFEADFTDYIVNEYHKRPHSGDGMNRRSPLQRWNAGIHEGDVMPARGVPDLPLDPHELKLSLLPVLGLRVVKQGVVHAFNEKYYSHELADLSDRLDARPTAPGRKFDIRYDPRDISVIWIDQGPDLPFIAVRFANRELAKISLWEHRAARKRLGRPTEIYEQDRIDRSKRSMAREDASAKATEKVRRASRREDEKRKRGELHRAPALKPVAPKVKVSDLPVTEERKAMLRKRLPAPV